MTAASCVAAGQAAPDRQAARHPGAGWAQPRAGRLFWGLLSLLLHGVAFWWWGDQGVRIVEAPLPRLSVRLIPAAPAATPRPDLELATPLPLDRDAPADAKLRRAPTPLATASTRRRQSEAPLPVTATRPSTMPASADATGSAPTPPPSTAAAPSTERLSTPGPSAAGEPVAPAANPGHATVPGAQPGPSPLRLELAPRPRHGASAPQPGLIEQALNDPRANSARASAARRLAHGFGADAPLTEEPLADGRRRVRKGTTCVDVQLSQTARLNPFDDQLRDVRVAKGCD